MACDLECPILQEHHHPRIDKVPMHRLPAHRKEGWKGPRVAHLQEGEVLSVLWWDSSKRSSKLPCLHIHPSICSAHLSEPLQPITQVRLRTMRRDAKLLAYAVQA